MMKELSILMLVSNRQDEVIRAIESLKPIREAVSTELILVDTGCSKELRTELEARGDKVISFSWCNDFAKARNAGLEIAEGKWFLFLDDDEFFEDAEEIILFFKSGICEKFGFASYIVRNYLDFEGNTYTDSHVGRIAKRVPGLRFEGKIHEYMTGKVGEGIHLKARVGHFGYVFGSEEARRKHFERNVSLIEEMIAEEPEQLHWGAQLIQEYRAIEAFDEMISCAAKYLPLALEQKSHSIAGTFFCGMVIAYKGLKQYDMACEWSRLTLSNPDISDMCKAFVSEMLAYALFELGEFQEAFFYVKRYLESNSYFQDNPQALSSQMDEIFVSEAFSKRRLEEAHSILICCDLLSGSTECLEKYTEELHWESSSVYVYEHMAEVLILAMNEMGPKECFLRIARRIWSIGILHNYFVMQINEMAQNEDIRTAIAIFQQVDSER